jgi:hypothetical protein
MRKFVIAMLIALSLATATVALADGFAWICDDDRCILIDLSTGETIPN